MVALHGLVVQFETNFGVVALQFLEEDRLKENAPSAAAITPSGWIVVGGGQSPTKQELSTPSASPSSTKPAKSTIRQSLSTSQLSSYAGNSVVGGKL